MRFFSELPDPTSGQDEPEITEIPAWVQPSNDEVPVAVPLVRVLASKPGMTLSLVRADVFSSGVSFVVRLDLRADETLSPEERDEMQALMNPGRSRHGIAHNQLRFGITLPDGRAVTADNQHFMYPWGSAPEEPTLSFRGGGGGGDDRRWTSTVEAWLWPLPEPGIMNLHFVCETLGIEEGSVEIDTHPFAAAATGVLNVRG